MRLLYCGSGWLPVVELIRERLPAGASISIWDRAVPLTEAIARVDVVLPSNARIDAEVIEAAASVRLLQQPAAGIEGIDVVAAQARGIPVCNAPGANHVAVAEAALLLMLALARRWRRATASFAAAEIGAPIGSELAGKTLGIIGLGRSGTALAECARALGMEVIAVTSTSDEAERYHLLQRADFVSLHCPLTADTRGLIGRRALTAMKPGAMLINCARGGIVDRPALEEALRSGRLGGVGLDTYWEEPWDPADPLFARDDVVTLPHVAGSTIEALTRVAELVADNVGRLARGEPLLHRVG